MSTAGPELPPHLLAKRKRQAEEEERAAQKANTTKSDEAKSQPQSVSSKRQRIAGPAPPPAPLDQRPSHPPDDSDSSDDDFGPAPPTSTTATTHSAFDDLPDPSEANSATQAKAKRDDWMMVPPSHDDLASNMDPTKLRARGFKTGRAGGAPPAKEVMGAAWLETPEEKKKRLADAVLGIAPSSGSKSSKDRSADAAKAQRQRENEETARRIKESQSRDGGRGQSLYEGHQVTNGESIKEQEDDPSARAFDREKDVGGVKIGNAQRKELLRNAKGFSGKFSGGGYL